MLIQQLSISCIPWTGYRRRPLEAAEQKYLIWCAEAHVHGCIKNLSGLACSDTVREKKKKRETLKASLRDGAIENEIMKMQMSQSHKNNSGSITDTNIVDWFKCALLYLIILISLKCNFN